LLPWMTVERNIRFVLAHELAESEIADRVRDVLELMGLRDFADYYPHQISGGMQQRVAIARALAFRPGVILMDEPFSHLDEITARMMRAEMVSLWRRTRTTILFVTHDLAEACYLSEQVVLLTPKPTTVHARVPVRLPFPRTYGSDAMFDAERNVLRLFEEAIGGSLNARQRAALQGQPETTEKTAC
jgi:ABC-type nitrate/sulfonate/bicarbonate transport system ATPase subunit